MRSSTLNRHAEKRSTSRSRNAVFPGLDVENSVGITKRETERDKGRAERSMVVIGMEFVDAGLAFFLCFLKQVSRLENCRRSLSRPA